MLAGLAGLAAGGLLSRRAGAGPLNPPFGPITPTGKTLTEVEPRTAINCVNTPGTPTATFRITQPGSYYLTGDIDAEFGKVAIEIAASNVAIDLMGFSVINSLDSPTTGIVSVGVRNNITIQNGVVRDWGEGGIDLSFSTGISSMNSVIDRVIARSNSGDGIRVASQSVVRDCIAENNSGNGIRCEAGAAVGGCIANGNGLAGIVTGSQSIITNCSSSHNSSRGIHSGSECVVIGCSGSLNGSHGIEAISDALISQCVASFNSGHGILVQTSSAVTECQAGGNAMSGIVCVSSCRIAGCVSTSNLARGISVSSFCQVLENLCDGNGAEGGNGPGILCNGSRNRIEGNACYRNTIGINVTAGTSGNFVSRNICGQNSTFNWSIGGSNILFVVSASTTSGFSGNQGGVSPGSTNPNANYTV